MKLLVYCLNSGCNVSFAVWQEIEENRLLPPKSTKHVKSAIALNGDRSPHNSRSDKIAKVANNLKIICVYLRLSAVSLSLKNLCN